MKTRTYVILGLCIIAIALVVCFLKCGHKPDVTVSLGKYTLKANEQVELHYLVDTSYKNKKCLFPLPLSFSNNEEESIRGFYLQFSAGVKPITAKSYMKRMLISEDQSRISLHDFEPSSKGGIQKIENTSYTVFHPGEKYQDLIMLNAVTDNPNVVENSFDHFNVVVKTTFGETERRFNIESYFHFTDDFQHATRIVRLDKERGTRYFVIRVTYNKSSDATNGNVFYEFSVAEENGSIEEV